MSSKSETISEIVTELQTESLQTLKKLFNEACKSKFEFDVRTIHQMFEKQKLFDQHRIEK